MSFDARSRERLEALGRRLPQKLPPPLPTSASPGPAAPAPGQGEGRQGRAREGATRHRLETEENPEVLFRALMQASADGSVPPHLLERLRELEQRRPGDAFSGITAPGPGTDSAVGASSGVGAAAVPRRPSPPRGSPPRDRERAPSRRADPAQVELYAAFDDLLHLEGDAGPESPPRPNRPSNDRLMPRPTLRQPRPGS